MKKVVDRAAWLVSTAGGVGMCPVAPGTAGSLWAVGAFLLFRDTWLARPEAFLGLILLTLLVGAAAAGREARRCGGDDPGHVVSDEVVGQWVALWAIPVSWPVLLAAFLLFRAADIWKPWPVNRAERLPGGWGIMLDDVVAGVYANLAIRAALWGWPLLTAWLGGEVSR